MNKILCIVLLTVAALVIGCSSEEPILPPKVEDPAPVYGAELHAAPLTLYLPHVTTTTLWGNVLGEPASVRLYLDGELYAQSPDAAFTATEAGQWEFVLEVTYDAEHIITRSVIVTATEEVVEPGSPLAGMMTVVPNGLIAPFQSTISLYAWGGELPYAFEIEVGGEVYAEATVDFVAEQAGEYPVTGTITDADGHTVTFQNVIQANALEPDELPALIAAGFGNPQNSHAPVTASLGVFPSGGDGDYDFGWFYSGDLFSTEQFPVYPGLLTGEHVFTVLVTDGTGIQVSDDVTITVLEPVIDDPDPLEINVTASTSNLAVPFSTTLDVDVFGGTLPYTFEWQHGGEVIAQTKSIELLIADVGIFEYWVTVTDAHDQIISDRVYVIGLSPGSDDPDPLTVIATAAPSVLVVPFVTTLDADPEGGTLPYSYQWWHNGELVGETESISYSIGQAEEYEFTVIVMDADNQTAEANVTVTGLEAPGTEVITWQVNTDLKVGPLDPEDTELVTTGQTGWNRIWFYLEFDVDLDDLADVYIEIVYTNGSRRYWVIPDVGDYCCRPNYVLVDGGEALIESVLRVNLYFEDGMYDRDDQCSGWDRLHRIHGSREVPAGYAGVPIVQLRGQSLTPVQ